MSRTPNTEAEKRLDPLKAAMLLGDVAQLRGDAEAEPAMAAADRDKAVRADRGGPSRCASTS